MSPKKLTDDDKQEILKLYRQTAETTSTLADHYGVSSSTISRFLKNTLSESEYEELIQQKRLARTVKVESQLIEENQSQPEPIEKETKPTPLPPSKKEIKGLSLPTTDKETKPLLIKKSSPQTLAEVKVPLDPQDQEEEDDDELEVVDVIMLREMLGEDISDDGDDDDDDDLNDEEWDDDDTAEYDQALSGKGKIQVLPLSAATFPKICYLVIDRTAELIARPLKEFAHLGQIPADEIQQKTLPVFDNHRVARRFSNRSQRVIKVPDGRLLYKTCSYLHSKGITRLLIDGQIYSLASSSEN